MTRTQEILTEARDLLITKGWWQGGLATTDGVTSTQIGDPNAIAFCAYGAVCEIDESDEAVGSLFRALEEITSSAIGPWNDAPDRTFAEVLALFDRAIELAA